MIALFTASLLLVSGVSASYGDAANEVYSAASALNDKVKGWSSAEGVQGALAIQGDFPKLSSALSVFSNTLGVVKASDVDVEGTDHSLNLLGSLLQGLTEKASDFASVSLTNIVANDLKEISKPSEDIINNLVKLTGEDSSKWQYLSKDISDFEVKMNSANQAYGIPEIHFSAVASGSGDAKSSSSSSELLHSGTMESHSSSGAKASATTAKAMTSGKAVGPISKSAETNSNLCARKNGAAHITNAKNSTSNATETHKNEECAQSLPMVKNAGAMATVGVCGVAAGVVAMLL